MNQESLEKIFGEIKNSPPETTIHDVSGWLNDASVGTTQTGNNAISLTTKIISMISIITIAITGSLYFMADKNASVEKKITPPAIEKSYTSTSPQQGSATIKLIKKDTVIKMTVLPPKVKDSMPTYTIIQTEKHSIEPEKAESIDRQIQNDQPIADKQSNEVCSGFWKSRNDSLNIDTVFNGVKKIVFRGGYINNKIAVKGSPRNNVNFNFMYIYKAKGLFVGKSRCDVSFEKIDSVLTIKVSRNKSVNLGVSYTKLNSNVRFEVPENMAIEIVTDYGDIGINNLRDNIYSFKTNYGDISAETIQGDINLNTNYGDIKLDHINGKVIGKTNFGDVSGRHITGSETVELKSVYGDIHAEITNSITDCSLNLRAGYGKIKVERKDLEIKSDKYLSFGTGGVKVSAVTGYGDVIIK